MHDASVWIAVWINTNLGLVWEFMKEEKRKEKKIKDSLGKKGKEEKKCIFRLGV